MAQDLLNKKFGKLLVLGRVRNKVLGGGRIHAMWLCRCDCGGTKFASTGDLNAGHTTSCGCLWKGKKKEPFEALYNSLKYAAKKRKIDFCLTFEEFLTFTLQHLCTYCGRKVEWKKHCINGPSATNIDRKNNDIGYKFDNCIVCCYICNKTKSNYFTYEEFLQLAPIIKNIIKKKEE